MGKRTYSTNVAFILLVASFASESVAKAPSWGPPPPALSQTKSMSPGQLAIDCEELAADPNIPAFLIQELCSPQPDDSTTQAEAEEEAENAATEETDAQETTVPQQSATETEANDQALQDPSQVIVPFFRVVIRKLINADDKKVSPKDFWMQAYQEAGAPKLSRHPSFFELLAGFQQSVDSFRSESSWWRVVSRLEDLTKDSQWKRLEASLVAAHWRDPGALWRTLGIAKAVRSALKSALEEPQCRHEGVNPDPEDCREFYICFRLPGRWKSMDAKCPHGTEFSPSRQHCVWAPLSDCQADRSDADSGSDSDSEDSREVLERIFKHGPGAFHYHRQ